MAVGSDPDPHPRRAIVRRDMGWRALGGALILAGYGMSGVPATAMPLLGFVAAIGGLVLLVQGRRVVTALRVECSRHRGLPLAIHAVRVRRMTKRRGRR